MVVALWRRGGRRVIIVTRLPTNLRVSHRWNLGNGARNKSSQNFESNDSSPVEWSESRFIHEKHCDIFEATVVNTRYAKLLKATLYYCIYPIAKVIVYLVRFILRFLINILLFRRAWQDCAYPKFWMTNRVYITVQPSGTYYNHLVHTQ
jgi:hypothetical protein